MLPFKNRLTKRKEIEKVQKAGYPFFLENLILKVAQNGLKDARIGFLVSSKIFRMAIERNQIKRMLREIFRPEISHFKPGNDILVVIRRREGEKLTFEKLKKNAQEIIKKANLSEKPEIK